jgi:hypothetical protein
MALLTDRQRTAESLAHELHSMGAWCVSPMPLDGNSKLRFQVLDADRNAIIEKLSSWNWSPTFVSTLPRICPDGWKLASLYELDLPRENTVCFDDRIQGELATGEKPSAECVAMLEACLGRKWELK